MKNWIKKGTALCTAALVAAAAVIPAYAADDKYETSRIVENPAISLSDNLSIQNGVSEDVLWKNTEGTTDFDFGPGGDNLQDAYILYEYGTEVKLDGINMIGWWPSDQGLKNISVYYQDENDEWTPVGGMENYEIPWTAKAGNNGATAEFANGEKIHLEFQESVVTDTLKLQINSTYTSWSSKINMRLAAPVRLYTEAEEELQNVIDDLKSYADSVLTGELPGEFPEEAVKAAKEAVKAAEELFAKPGVTEEEIKAAAENLKEAKETFLSSQNEFPTDAEYRIKLENLEIVSGKEGFLNDRQISTGAVLQKTDASEKGYLVFDFGNKKFALEQITILAENPAEQGLSAASLEYWDGAEWKVLAEKSALGWTGGYERMEGRSVTAGKEGITASKFRVAAEETASEDGRFSMQEIFAQGNEKAGTETLEELVQYAGELVASAENADTKEVDMVRFKLISATNADTLARADQKKIDYLYAELLAAVNKLDEAQGDKIAPSDPLNVKVEETTENSVTVSFDPASDNRGVAGYKIYSGERVVADVAAPDGEGRITAKITDLADGTEYTFVIKAYDAAGNLSQGVTVHAETLQGEIPDVPDKGEEQNPGGTGNDKDTGAGGDTPDKAGGRTETPKTGDEGFGTALWIAAAAAALAAGAAAARRRR